MNKRIFYAAIMLGVCSMTVTASGKERLFIIMQDNMPPFGAEERLATKGEYEQELVFLFTNRSNKKDFIPVIYTKKPYKKLYVRTGGLVYNDWPDTFLLCAYFDLPEKIRFPKEEPSSAAWVTDGEYYWLNGFFAKPQRRGPGFIWPQNYNFENIFIDRLNTTEPFECYIELWYHFDDEPEKHIVLNYTVEPREVDEQQRKRGGW